MRSRAVDAVADAGRADDGVWLGLAPRLSWGYIWGTFRLFGPCLGCMWAMFGPCLGYMYRLYLGYIWASYAVADAGRADGGFWVGLELRLACSSSFFCFASLASLAVRKAGAAPYFCRHFLCSSGRRGRYCGFRLRKNAKS